MSKPPQRRVKLESPVLAFDNYASNAELIVALHRLGYIQKSSRTLDPTFGAGTFWKVWRPKHLTCSDIKGGKGVKKLDFTKLPFKDGEFDVVVFDGPYRLNGTPDPDFDARYGTEVVTKWQDRMALLEAGVVECARVCNGILIIKCMDQVCSGAVRWQTDEFTRAAEKQGFKKIDRLHFAGGREQPTTQICSECKGSKKKGKVEVNGNFVKCKKCKGKGKYRRVQRHARNNFSTAIVLERKAA